MERSSLVAWSVMREVTDPAPASTSQVPQSVEPHSALLWDFKSWSWVETSEFGGTPGGRLTYSAMEFSRSLSVPAQAVHHTSGLGPKQLFKPDRRPARTCLVLASGQLGGPWCCGSQDPVNWHVQRHRAGNCRDPRRTSMFL